MATPNDHASSSSFLTRAYTQVRAAISTSPTTALPLPEALQAATAQIAHALPTAQGHGNDATLAHLLSLTPGFNGSSLSANYYGFVTGGVLPIAEAADNIVTAWDQNVQVHLPGQSVCTEVESAAVEGLVRVLALDEGFGRRFETGDEKGLEVEVGKLGRRWQGTFTTGATASNVLGLACGREGVLQRRLGNEDGGEAVGELGILAACRRAGVDEIQVLTTMAHSSLYKAASIVGLGRASVKDISVAGKLGVLNWEQLEVELARVNAASIVALSAGDVNSGGSTTGGWEDMVRLRKLCWKYGAWIHVDGAFGMFARALPDGEEFAALKRNYEGLELADSITGDLHKCLNVPYDSGFFLTRALSTLTAVCQNPNAAYLSASSGSSVPSPLNIGLQNSRRFRALPVYAVLYSLGADGISSMLANQVRLARRIAEYIDQHEKFELWNGKERSFEEIGIIVLFGAKDEGINDMLVERINADGRVYLSGTVWNGRKAARVAVSTWKVDIERDLEIVREVLDVAAGGIINSSLLSVQ